ncbi:MAG: hypothetical protein JJV97_01555 [SAR324 cluster bacterium]|nr:hypothetical protein [SAR324 cluster bacterium]
MKGGKLIIVFLLIMLSIGQVFAKMTLFVEKESVPAYKDDSLSKKSLPLKRGAYQIVDVKNTIGKVVLLKIIVLLEKTTPSIGYALTNDLKKNLANYQLVKVFKTLPDQKNESFNYQEIAGVKLKDTGNRVSWPLFDMLLVREVIFKEQLKQFLWVESTAGTIIAGISSARINVIIKTADKLKLDDSSLRRALNQQIDIDDPYQIVLAALGDPLQIDYLQKSLIRWRYYDKNYIFKRGQVKRID